ncbi:hypothetical protein MMC19_007352 [Ptychographa xylographoides]|nr:hypothetical protein [Ptychographa xylographoides]
MSACKTAFSNLSPLEVRVKSKAIEESAFENAFSKENYRDLCDQSVRDLRPHNAGPEPSSPCEDKHDLSNSINLRQIGPYTACYHQSGLFSTIFQARERTSPISTVVALKLTTPSQMSPPHNSLREARLLSLAAHTNTIPLLSTFHQPGGHFILVFPFMPHTLEDLLHQHTLTVTHIRFCLHNVFSALAHVHSLGIIHRDIKPSNILFASPSGPAYLADFGIAWMEGDAASEPADQKITDVGTTAYRPPELLFGNATYNTSLDIWAAGCVLAETLLRVRKTLFDPGPLGSDLALIKSIFETLGTPTIKNWPEAAKYPDWGKIQFYEYPAKSWEEILPDADTAGRDLVSRLVLYESGDRLEAPEVVELVSLFVIMN